MGAEQWVNIAVGVAVIGFLWNLHRGIAGLRQRMARLEGLVEGFIGAPIRGRHQSPCQQPWAGAAGVAEPVR